jgi:fucose permease
VLGCFWTAYFLAGVSAGALPRRLGAGRVLTASVALSAAGLGLAAAAPAWSAFVPAITLVGLGGGALDATLNTTAALDTGTSTLNAVHACFAIGATVGPIALAVLLSVGGSWRLVIVASSPGRQVSGWPGFGPHLPAAGFSSL